MVDRQCAAKPQRFNVPQPVGRGGGRIGVFAGVGPVCSSKEEVGQYETSSQALTKPRF